MHQEPGLGKKIPFFFKISKVPSFPKISLFPTFQEKKNFLAEPCFLMHQLLCDKEANIPNSDILTGPETSKIIDKLEQDKMYGAYSTETEQLIVTRNGVEV